MLANTASARPFAQVDSDAQAMLAAPQRPIVLLPKRAGCDDMLAGVAPGLAWLGVMLPYTPLQYLLFHEAAGRPAGVDWLGQPQPLALVMTSANPGGEPLVIGDGEALSRLAGIADAFVLHDRAIVTRCDDSVLRLDEGGAGFIRRARGYTPQAIALAGEGPSVLACGAYFKNTICYTRGDQAFVSQHIGELDNAATCAALEDVVERLGLLLRARPEVLAHDLHPDFFSSRFAADHAASLGLPLVAVQHHHAHIAAVMAEHRLAGEVLGLALDGVGLGSDGGIWGGELLRASALDFQRLGHLRELALPGGDKAAREPWRMGAAALFALGRGGEIRARYAGHPAARALPLMLASGVHAPPTSSCGRWFDAAAGLAGVRDTTAFEGQAAMLYEGLAAAHGAVAPLAGGHAVQEDGTLDLLPLLARLADEADAGFGAALFHATLAEALADWAWWAAQRTGLTRVCLGGGCFLNAVLSRALRANLRERGLDVFEARAVPPNDGGLALGQAWVARQRLMEGL
jgi:hydrogenase maturation protein HypF